MGVLVLLAVAATYRFFGGRPPVVVWTGTVEARTALVGSRTGGRVDEIFVREADHVEAGQPLLRLEEGDLPAQREAALAAREEARAQLARLVSRARPGATARAAEIATARARLSEATAVLEKARIDAARARRLAAGGAVPLVDVEDAETVVRTSEARRDQQAEALRQLETGTASDRDVATAAVRAAEARLAAVDVAIRELVITASRSARVETLDLRPGDILAPNAAAATLLEDDQLFVRIYIPETQLGFARTGQEVLLRVDSFPDRRFRGFIAHIAGVGEYTPRNLQTADERAAQVFAARVEIVEGRHVLRAGMAAFVDVSPPEAP